MTHPSLIRGIGAALLVLMLAAWPDGAARAADPKLALSLLDGKVQLRFMGQYRARLTFSTNRDFVSGKNPTFFSQRARLGIAMTYTDLLEFYIMAQDVRTWGEESDTLSDFAADAFDLHQVWVAVKIINGLKLKIGRQEVNLDGQRLIGSVNWTDQARSFDGIRLIYQRKGIKFTLFYAKLGEADAKNSTFSLDRDLGVVWLHYGGFSYLKPSLLYVLDTDYTLKRTRHTVGVYLKGAVKGFSYRAEGYLQLGEQGGADIFAFLASAKLGYTIKRAANFGVDLWFDFVSGDDDPASGKIKSFDTLFATNHKFYGFMDFFLNVPVHTKGRGLMDAGLRLRVKPMAKIKLMLDYHFFRAARTFSNGDSVFGHELDLTASYKPYPFFSVMANYGLFIPGAAFKTLFGDKIEHVVYLTTNLQF